MSEVRYSVNGKYFKDFGMYISDSDGLFDGLKRKAINTYDWAEYNGSAPDLSNPKFEAREITLKGFVSGGDWLQMKSNFDSILTEFQKSGTQRLLIEPLGLKALPFEVYLEDSTPLSKTFKDRKMVGVFTLKLTEPNPIKKVLYFTGSTLNLSYTSPSETEIFYGNGLKEIAKGNVSLSGKTLVNRYVSGYPFSARNLLPNSNNINLPSTDYAGTSTVEQHSDFCIVNGWETWNRYLYIQNQLTALPDFAKISIDIKTTNVIGNVLCVMMIAFLNNGVVTKLVEKEIENNYNTWKRYAIETAFTNYTHIIIGFRGAIVGLAEFHYRNVKVGQNEVYTPAPEDEKFIIIAGNVNEISNLTTNAEVLWERL